MRNVFLFVFSVCLLSACESQTHSNTKMSASAQAAPTKPKRVDLSQIDASKYEIATLAGGCFWKMDAAYQELKGVAGVAAGYSGGNTANPSYEQVCSHTTGHAETIQIAFDPQVVSFKEILEAFWTLHNPTQVNREGNDEGESYRSVVFYNSDAQKKTAEEVKAQLVKDGKWSKIVTQITPYTNFYRAEDYHQDYYNHHKEEGYCASVVAGKVRHFEEVYKDKLRQ